VWVGDVEEAVMLWDDDCQQITITYRYGKCRDYSDFIPDKGAYENMPRISGNPIIIKRNQVLWFIQTAREKEWKIKYRRWIDGEFCEMDNSGIYKIPFKSILITLRGKP
jgi:hypothetical protein